MDLKRNLFIYWILQQKFYFDTGLGTIGYFKYVIAGYGVAFKDPTSTLYIGIATIILCYFIGLIWAKFGLVDVSNDISNKYNPFVQDTSETLKHLSKNKKFK